MAYPNSLPALVGKVPDPNILASPCREVGQDTITISFIRSGSGLLTNQMTQRTLGTGVSVNQASGALNVLSGTTANAEFLARSNENFKSSHIASFRSYLSQRIANNNFMFLVADITGEGLACTINSSTSITVTVPGHSFVDSDVGQSLFVGAITGAAGVPGRYAIASVIAATSITLTVSGWPASGSCTVDLFGYNHAKILYNGTTATSALFDASRKGWASGDTTITINTTANPGHLVQIQDDGRNLYVSDMLTASSSTPNVTTRGSRVESIPDDNALLYLYVWAFNGTSAPASTTTWTIGMIDVEDFANVPVYIAGQRMQGTQSPQAVQVVGTAAVSLATNAPTLAAGTNLAGDVGVQYRANATGAATAYKFASAASTNSALILTGARRLVGYSLTNTTASIKYFKFYNKATAPTVGTDTPLFVVGVPASSTVSHQLPGGMAVSLGLGIGCTGAVADADTTATAVNDVVGAVFYA